MWGRMARLDGGSRGSLEARGRLGIDAGGGVLSLSGRGERGDGFIPVTAATRGPADEAAPYREWSGRGRWVLPVGSASGSAGKSRRLSRLANARNRFHREPHQWRRRVDSIGQPQRMAVERARLLAMAQPDEQLRQRRCRASRCEPSVASIFGALARARREPRSSGRRCLAELSCGSAPTPARPAENRASSSPISPAIPRGGGPRVAIAGHSGAFAEATADLGDALTGGARLDHWSIANGHFSKQTIATDVVSDATIIDPSRGGWLPTARGGVLGPAWRRV